MGRSFAGILGLVAFSTSVLRAAIAGHSPDSALLTATILLFAFTAGGWVLGSIAESTVEHAVRTRFEAELKAAGESDSRGRSSGSA